MEALQMRLKNCLRVSLIKKPVALAFLLGLSTFAHAEDAGLPLHGFGDVGGGYSSKNTPADQRINGFKIGTIDFYLNPEFEDRVKSLMEIAFEPKRDTGEIAVDVERLQVGYTFSNALTLWAGRFHTPYGIWNTAYHHGAQLQTSVYRPKFLDFEDAGGIMGAHHVGLWGKGGVKFDSFKINYNLYVSNGSRIAGDALDMNNYRNDTSHMAVGGSLSYAGTSGALDGFEIGAHAESNNTSSYTDNSYAASTYRSTTKVMMTGGFLSYMNNGWEIMGEYYGFANKGSAAGAKTIKSNAQYAQMGYAFAEVITPYLRFEKTALNQNDSYFADQASGRSYTRMAFGLRKDLNNKAAIKAEYLNTSKDGSNPKYNIFQYSYAIRF